MYWFHVAIPTAVVDHGVRSRLRRVTVLFEGDPGVTLAAIHVWDGPNRVFNVDELSVGGAFRTIQDGRNSFVLPDLEVFWGIGVSVLFRFANDGNVGIHSVGVDLEA